MIKSFKIAVALMIAAAFAIPAFALSDEYVQFGKGPAQFLMTKDEQAQWKAVNTDDQAKAFITSFWARRGERFKQEFEAKVKYADEHFADSRLVFVTEGAVAVREGETPGLALAPLWGLVRSAQSEQPRTTGVDV